MTQVATGTPDPSPAAGPRVPRPAAVRGPARTLTRTAPAVAPPLQRRRLLGGVRASDVYALVGAAVGAASLVALIYTTVAPFSGALGYVVLTYVAFVGLYALVVSFDEDAMTVRNRVAAVVVASLALVLLGALVFVVVFAFVRAREALVHLGFFSQDLAVAGPLDPLTKGGVLHAIVGTLEMISIALVITIPTGLTCAVFLSELPGAYARFVRTIVEAMTALPSIVAGLFIYATLILSGILPKSGFAAALAISVMMLPIIVRAADVVLRLVAGTLKEASYALGASQWRTVWHVVLPTARSGLMTAIILGTARGIGETSPVLITAGYTTQLNLNPFSGPQVSLPLATFELVRSSQDVQVQRGFGAAAILLTMVLVLFGIARTLGGRPPGDLTPRQARRVAARSADDARRFARRSGISSEDLLGVFDPPPPPRAPSPSAPAEEGRS